MVNVLRGGVNCSNLAGAVCVRDYGAIGCCKFHDRLWVVLLQGAFYGDFAKTHHVGGIVRRPVGTCVLQDQGEV